MSKTEFYPTLPLRDIVIFPNMVIPLFVGRDKSIKALNEVMKTNKKIILVTQKNAEIDDPNPEDIYSIGCESKVLQLLKLPDGTVKVLAEGLQRVKILEYKKDKEYLESLVEIVEDEIKNKEDSLAFAIAMVRKLEKLTNLNKKLSFELMTNLKELKDKYFKGIDVVFHLAALADIVPSINNPEKYFNTNVKGTLNILPTPVSKAAPVPGYAGT